MAEFRGGGGGWTGFGSYMRDKTIKLAGQFDERFEKESDLFSGKTFWSTGRMEGVNFDVKEIVTRHGGLYLQYGFRNVSHIIASNLAMSNQNWKKLLGGKFTSKSYLIVTPQWLIDSMHTGECLPESDYLPDCLKETNDIRSFLGVTEKESPDDIRMLDEDYRINVGTIPRTKRLVRFDIPSPSDMMEVVEQFCCDLIEDGRVFSRDFATITISRADSVSIEGVNFQASSTSLSEALMCHFERVNWNEVTKISLSLCLFDDTSTHNKLEILSSYTGIPPTALNTHLNHLKSRLLESSEDTISETVAETLSLGGVVVGSILLDVFNQLVETRRIDVARDMVLALKSRIKSYPVDEIKLWSSHLELKFQRVFQLRNNGAILAL